MHKCFILIIILSLIMILPAYTESEYIVNDRPLTELSIEELYALEDALTSAIEKVFAMESSKSPSGEVLGPFVINARTKKFHYPYCFSALQIGQDRRFEVSTPSELIARGYKPCGQCKP